MPDFMRKLLGRKPTPRMTDEDADLERFFTDAEHACQVFEQMVGAAKPSKRLLVIHGVGGVGKSTLLKMYRLSCRRRHIPVALVGGEEAPSPAAVLSNWADDLSSDKIRLPAFQATLTHYRAIQAKVDEQVRKVQEAHGKAADIAGKAASKAAEAAVGAATGAAVGSIIPGIGTVVGSVLGGVVGGASAEAFVDWLRGFLSKPDLELYLDPTKRLTDDFVTDLARAAAHQRLVLMADTYERMTALDDWMRDLAQRLPENVLLVIAGRVMPEWDRAWPGWLAWAEMQELKPMSEEDMHLLVRRYYATIRGGEPDPKQVKAILRFARGLPMVVTSAVQLWVAYGVEDFQVVKPQVVADLVDRLMEGVPKEMIPALEAAAVLRWFNKEILRTVTGQADVNAVYGELQRFPFVRSRAEGPMLHDAVREIMDENLRIHDPGRYRELHKLAAEFHEDQRAQEQPFGDKWQRFTLEFIYHHLCLGEVDVFPTEVERAASHYRHLFAQRLIHDIETYGRSIADTANLKHMLLYHKGQNLIHHNRFMEARIIFQQLLSDTDLTDDHFRALVTYQLGKANYWAGRFKIADGLLREGLDAFYRFGDDIMVSHALGYIGSVLAFRGRLSEASSFYKSQIRVLRILMRKYIQDLYAYCREKGNLAFSLAQLLRIKGKTTMALRTMQMCLKLRSGLHNEHDIGIAHLSLAELHHAKGLRDEALLHAQAAYSIFEAAQDDYTLSRILLVEATIACDNAEFEKAKGLYLHAASKGKAGENIYTAIAGLAGAASISLTQRHIGEVVKLCDQAEGLLMDTEFWDLFARLKLLQGCAAMSEIPETVRTSSRRQDFDIALHYFKQALTYALRYNRFLLDEVLWGGGITTPLRPIIPHCLECGEEGHRMLTALRDWWRTGVNDIGTPRPDTISPIPEGISLLEAERMAREREPGDGSPQWTVVEQIEKALG